MLKEFRDFAMRGNVLDMAIGVIIGGAFGKIVSSLVSDVLMPPLGLLMGKVDFSSLFVNLSGTPQPSLVKQVNRFKKEAPAGPPTTKDCPQCLSTIPIKATRCAHCTSNV